MKKKPIIFILADALRHDYIKIHSMEFLSRELDINSQIGPVKVEPSTGFCEIIEYLSGKKASEHGLLCQINRRKNWHEIKYDKYLGILQIIVKKTRKIPKLRGAVSIAVTSLLKKVIPEDILRVRYNIPLDFLSFFEPTESKTKYDDISFGGGKNILRELRKSNFTIDMNDFVEFNKIEGTDDDRINNLLHKINNKSLEDFTMYYLGYCEMAHFWGTENSKFSKLMRQFDDKIKSIHDNLKNNYNDFDLYIVGDHGMVEVEEYIDIENFIRKYLKDLKKGVDYIYFIDSTIVRIWFHPEIDKKIVSKTYYKLENVLSSKIEKSNINSKEYLSQFQPDYGEIMFLLKSGKVFFPDFFSNEKNKGMHGYCGSVNHQLGSFFHFDSKGIKKYEMEKIHLSDVYDILRKNHL